MLITKNKLRLQKKSVFIVLIILVCLSGITYLYLRQRGKTSPVAKEMRQAYEQTLKTQINDKDQQKMFQIEKDLDSARQLIAQNKLKEAYDLLLALKDKYKQDSTSLDNINTYLIDVCIKLPKEECIDSHIATYTSNPQQYVRITLWIASKLDEAGQTTLAKKYYKKGLNVVDANGGSKFIDTMNSQGAEMQYNYKNIQEKSQ